MTATAAMTDIQLNWMRIGELTTDIISKNVRNAARSEIASYTLLLNSLRNNRYVGPILLLGLHDAPASKNHHHSVKGGLTAHILQMWDIWVGMRDILLEHGAGSSQLSDLNIWKCILHHDLNKVWKYKMISEEPWKVDYSGTLDRTTMLLGDTAKVVYLLGQSGITLDVLEYNALLTAEGGFSKTPVHATTVLSKVAYILDELSANVVDRLQNRRFWESLGESLNVE